MMACLYRWPRELGVAMSGYYAAVTWTPPGAVIHSDSGTPRRVLGVHRPATASGVLPSMGGIAHCFENAVVESFSLQYAGQTARPAPVETRIELNNAIFE